MKNLILGIVVVVILEILIGSIALVLLKNIHIGERNYASGNQGYVTFPIWTVVFHELLHTMGASEDITTPVSIIEIIMDGFLVLSITRYLDIGEEYG